MNFHVALGMGGGLETELLVETVGVEGDQHPAADALQIGVGDNRADERLAQSPAPVFRQDEHIGQVGEGGAIGDDPGEGHLFAVMIDPEAEGILDHPFHQDTGNVFGPIGLRDETVDHLEIEEAGICRKDVAFGQRRNIHQKAVLASHNQRAGDHVMQGLFFLRKASHDIANENSQS